MSKVSAMKQQMLQAYQRQSKHMAENLGQMLAEMKIQNNSNKMIVSNYKLHYDPKQ